MNQLALVNRTSPWRSAFVLSIPILAGYVPIGVAFGVLWVQQGLPAFGAPLLGLLVYSGASQFMAAGMLAAGQGPVEVAVATFVLNARHAVYGLAFLDRFEGWSAAKAYFAFALTDETYAVLSVLPRDACPERDRAVFWRLALLNQVYWVAGCAIGAALGGLLAGGTRGLDFALSALFLVLLMEQLRSADKRLAAVVAALAAAAGILLLGSEGTMLPVLAGALCVLTLFGRRIGA
jgi:4-azaleucine resistance transporter AzlC